VASERGQDMAQTIARADRLREQLDVIRSSSPLNLKTAVGVDLPVWLLRVCDSRLR